MNGRSFFASVVGIVGALGLSACAGIPRGPALTYEQLLPNTHENPVWARNRAEVAPPPEPASAPAAPR